MYFLITSLYELTKADNSISMTISLNGLGVLLPFNLE